jgi:hypothetical protein
MDITPFEQRSGTIETTSNELSSYQLERIGCELVDTHGSLFYDLNQIIEHPLFQEFSQKYFKTWESTQLIVQLCQMYIDLDKLVTETCEPKQLSPFEKICLLQECVLKQLLLKDDKNDKIIILPHTSNNKTIEIGKRIYKTQPVLKDVADIMEYEQTSEFIKKYFIRWDTSDLVVVLIRLYECFNQYTTWTPQQKFGFLHHLMSDKAKRKLLAEKISEWKKQ